MNVIFFAFMAIGAASKAWEVWAIGPLIVGFLLFLILSAFNQ